jgi:HK97 gp10 family phage protein
MYDAQWSLIGFDRVIARMRGLPVALRGKAGRSALGSAARVVVKVAKANAQRVDDRETGRRIADNITQRFRSKYFKATGDLMISVGVATNKGPIPRGNPDEGPKGNTPHWHLLELGREGARAEPFLRPALESSINQVMSTFAVKLDDQITKQLAK